MKNRIVMTHQDIIETLQMVAATGKDLRLWDFKERDFTTAALD